MIKKLKKTLAIELKYLAEPLEDAHGTPVEKHWYTVYFALQKLFSNESCTVHLLAFLIIPNGL
jgi:hypothetical protein